jgi:hypothetical protein
MKLWRLPKIECSILKYSVPSLWPTYIGEKEDNICQRIWDKSEVLGRTCLGTHWELEEHSGNLMGTREKWKQKPSPCPKTWKEKKQGTLSACLGLPIGCMNFLFPKEFVTIFGLGQYPLQRTPYLLRLINWGCLTSPTFFFPHNDPIWLAHHKKKVETIEAPQK